MNGTNRFPTLLSFQILINVFYSVFMDSFYRLHVIEAKSPEM